MNSQFRRDALCSICGWPVASFRCPFLSDLNRFNIEAHTLIVRGVEPEIAIKHVFCLLEIAAPPQAQPITVQTTKPRAIIDPSPRQNAIAKSVKRQLAYHLRPATVTSALSDGLRLGSPAGLTLPCLSPQFVTGHLASPSTNKSGNSLSSHAARFPKSASAAPRGFLNR